MILVRSPIKIFFFEKKNTTLEKRLMYFDFSVLTLEKIATIQSLKRIIIGRFDFYKIFNQIIKAEVIKIK